MIFHSLVSSILDWLERIVSTMNLESQSQVKVFWLWLICQKCVGPKNFVPMAVPATCYRLKRSVQNLKN